MIFKLGLLFVTLLVGSLAIPRPDEVNLSRFFVDENVSSDANRIVGGNQAAAGAAPYMVALSDGFLVRHFICGGSIIGTRTVLTAAHCIAGVYSYFTGLSNLLRATAGTNRWNSGGRNYNIARNISHPHWSVKNDIGLLITTSNIVNTNVIQPVPVNYDFIPGGVSVKAFGWGRIRTGGAQSATLLELYTSTMEGRECEVQVSNAKVELDFPYYPDVESHIELCTYHSVDHGTCNGDSGGPLLHAQTMDQVGIVSWGFRCALGAPDVFVRLSAFKDFIEAHII